MVKDFLAVFIFSMLIIFLSQPFFQGFPSGHDTSAHLTYSKLFINELSKGQFPVRWTEGARPNTAQPLFNFYQVGFYYFVYLINIFSPSFLFSLKLSIILLWWFGTFFTFLLIKKFGILSAALGALIYASSPYLIFDVFTRASFPEFMALSFFPGLLWTLENIFSNPKRIYIIFFALFFAIIIFSHLPSVIIFLPVIAGFILLQVLTKKEKIRGFLFTCLGFLLGVGLASFYLLPAVLELSSVQINLLKSNSFDFHKNFLLNDFFKL